MTTDIEQAAPRANVGSALAVAGFTYVAAWAVGLLVAPSAYRWCCCWCGSRPSR
jgi:hypothetical protein